MKKISISIIIPVLLMAFISIISIKSAGLLTTNNYLFLKQIMWYLIGASIICFIIYIGNDFIYGNIEIIYLIFNIMLLGLLFFGTPVNNAKCWYNLGFMTIQPSEFMKIILIIINAKYIAKFKSVYKNPTLKQEFIFILKIGILTLIPSVLTFLEPDTGVVIIYLLITIVMLFISQIRIRWFVILFSIIIIVIVSILIIYYSNTDLFVKILGPDFFLRIERLLNWYNKSGYQLERSLILLGTSSYFGYGINSTPLYIPEATTDFIFSVYGNNFGFIGSLFLIGIFIFFNLKLMRLASKSKRIDKHICFGTIGMILYQQFQNVGMTFGLLPITGITLPFISYGGSSLLSYMIIIGILINVEKKSLCRNS